MKKLFFDTEFTGLHKDTTLVSIGIVSDCGRTFYAESTDYDEKQIDNWIHDNVMNRLRYLNPRSKEISLPHITGSDNVSMCGSIEDIRAQLEKWMLSFNDKIALII